MKNRPMGREDSKRKTSKKNMVVSGLVAISLIFSLPGCGGKEDVLSAVTMRLQKMVGVVNLYDDKGAEQTIMEQMRLLSGQKITTAGESLIMVSLDETKIFTMEEKSKANIIKSSDGKNLEFNLDEGNLFFNVNEKLAEDQTLTIRSGNMICGIRGTSAYMGQNSKGEDVLMVTDGNMDVTIMDENQNVQTTESAGPGSRLVLTKTASASGNATVTVEKDTFKEEDLPPSALGAISSDEDLGNRVTTSCNFSDDKIKVLAEATTTKSSTGETIPIMGKAAEIMNEAAAKAGAVAGNDLKLEVAIITGSKGALEKGQTAGLNEDNLSKLVENTTKQLGECVTTGLNAGITSEELVEITNVVAGSMKESIGNMTTSGLAVEEVNQVITSMGNVFTEVIATAPASPISWNGGNTAGPAAGAAATATGANSVLARVNAASEQVKNTVNTEMRRESGGSVTANAVSGLGGGNTNRTNNNPVNPPVVNNTVNTINTTNTDPNTNSDNDENSGSSSNNGGNSSNNNNSNNNNNNNNNNNRPEEENTRPIPETRIVSFMDESGTTVLDTAIIEKGQRPVYTGAAPTKASDGFKSYTFYGWTDGASTYEKDAELPVVNANITYRAVFTFDYFTYTVRYELDGGRIDETYNTGYRAGTGLVLPTNVVKEDSATNSFTFEGWFTDASGGNQIWEIGVDETGNKTYYAHWIAGPIKYNTTVAAGIGRAVMKVDGQERIKVAPGETVELTITPPDGYKVADDGVSIAINQTVNLFSGSGYTYTFTMPADYTGGTVNISYSYMSRYSVQNPVGMRTVFASAEYGGATLDCNLTLNENLVIPAGKVLDLNGKVLTVANGATITNNGTIEAGQGSKLLISEGGTLKNTGTVKEECDANGIYTIDVFSAGTVTGLPEVLYQQVYATGFYDWSSHANTNIWYKLDNDGLLYLEGDGDMTDQVTGTVGSSWNMINVLPGQKSKVKNIILAYGITSVSQGAFYEVPATSVEMSGVKKIDKIAFYKSKVKTVNAPDAESIGYEAFYQCTDLESFIIPNSVKTIGAEAFFGCSKLEFGGIPTSITSIGKQAFDGSKLNGELVFPDSLTTIGDYAFENCTGISKVTYGAGMTSTGSHVFSGCTGITRVILPANIRTIGSYAFSGCSSLATIDLSNVTTLGERCFANTGLTTLTLPASVEAVPGYAFYECRSLKTVHINAKTLGAQSFYYCQAIDDFYVGEELTSVGQFALSGNHIKNIHYGGTPEKWTKSGFNSAFTGDSTPTWTLICDKYSIMVPGSVENGTITVEKDNTEITSTSYGEAAPGDTVSLSVSMVADEGYLRDGDPTVTTAGQLPPGDLIVSSGTLAGVEFNVSFTMPSASVTVGGAFKVDDTLHTITCSGTDVLDQGTSVTMTVDGTATPLTTGAAWGKAIVITIPRPTGKILRSVSFSGNGSGPDDLNDNVSPELSDDGSSYSLTFTMPATDLTLALTWGTPYVTLARQGQTGSMQINLEEDPQQLNTYVGIPGADVILTPGGSIPGNMAGFLLKNLTYAPLEGGTSVEITKDDEEKYKFTMPPYDVIINYLIEPRT